MAGGTVVHTDMAQGYGGMILKKQGFEGGGGPGWFLFLFTDQPARRRGHTNKYPCGLLLAMREEKNRVRQILRERKAALMPAERVEKSRRICRYVLARISDGETVMAYTSKELEVNTAPLIDALLKRKIPLVVPIIVKEDISLRLSFLRDRSVLVPSTFGVPEPIGSEIPARADDIKTILLPMLGFDRTGARIGYGAGYYDRFLEKHPGLRKIGIAFACQEIDRLPVDENDIRMDCIITEDGVVYSDGMCGDGDLRR